GVRRKTSRFSSTNAIRMRTTKMCSTSSSEGRNDVSRFNCRGRIRRLDLRASGRTCTRRRPPTHNGRRLLCDRLREVLSVCDGEGEDLQSATDERWPARYDRLLESSGQHGRYPGPPGSCWTERAEKFDR